MGGWSNYDNNVSDHRPIGLKLHFGTVSNISQTTNHQNRVFNFIDILGRDTHKHSKGLLLKIYNDRKVEKKIILE